MEQCKKWGNRLRGLVQGGLFYGVRDEEDMKRLNRLDEIGKELAEAEEISPERQKQLGAEMQQMGEIGMEEGWNDNFDRERYNCIRELGVELQA